MQRQSSSNPFLTVMMMFNIETKFVCTPSGNSFAFLIEFKKAIVYDTCGAFHRLQTRWIFWINVTSLRQLRNVRLGNSTQRFEISKAKRFSILASLFLKRIMQSSNCGLECWYLFNQIQKYIWNDSFRQIFLNFTMMKFAVAFCSFSFSLHGIGGIKLSD